MEMENFRIKPTYIEVGQGEGGLEAALTQLRPGTGQLMKELKKHDFFQTKNQKRRLKHRQALIRQKRWERKKRFYSRRDPKIFWALKEYERAAGIPDMNESPEVAAERTALSSARTIAPESDSVATVLTIIKKSGKFLTLEDKEKGGFTGFVTGGINAGETSASFKKTRSIFVLEKNWPASAALAKE